VILTSYDVDEAGVALLRLDRPEARNAINTQMLEEILGHMAAARDDERVRVLVLSSTDHMSLSAGADVREKLDTEGQVRRMELFARLYDELTAFPKPRSPSPATCGSVAPTCGCVSPARHSASRWGPRAWSASAASRWPSICC
jgi:hypothetical protein